MARVSAPRPTRRWISAACSAASSTTRSRWTLGCSSGRLSARCRATRVPSPDGGTRIVNSLSASGNRTGPIAEHLRPERHRTINVIGAEHDGSKPDHADESHTFAGWTPVTFRVDVGGFPCQWHDGFARSCPMSVSSRTADGGSARPRLHPRRSARFRVPFGGGRLERARRRGVPPRVWLTVLPTAPLAVAR